MLLPIDLAVAAGALRTTLHNMSGNCSGSEFVPLLRPPAKAMNHGSERQRGIGASARDHYVGASSQGFSQRKRPDVRVRAQDAIANRGQRLARIHVLHRVAGGEKLVELSRYIVAQHNSDF